MVNNPFDAEDLTQETFLSIYKNLSTYPIEYEKAWICKITSNKCLDYMKSASNRIQPTESEFFVQFPDVRQDPENDYLKKESKQYVQKVCNELKNPYGKIALQHFYYEKSAKEIAEETGQGIKTIQTQIYRARELIKKKIGGKKNA